MSLRGAWMNMEKDSGNTLQSALGISVLLFLGVLLSGCAAPDKATGFLVKGDRDGLPAKITGTSLRPGLETIFLFDKYRHVDEMHTSERGIAKFGSTGAPILQLNHRFGKGEVFGSGRSREVGVLLQGYFHLDTPGVYFFQAQSNDGFQLYIDGELIVSDPDVHGDRLSEPGQFEVVQTGMFPVAVKYFQRKGTATLELYWQPPGADSFTIVPREVYRH